MKYPTFLWTGFSRKHRVSSPQAALSIAPIPSLRFKWQLLLISLLPLMMLSSCRNSEPVAQAATGVAVKLETIETSSVTDVSEYIATLESRQSVTLHPRVAGLISSISVNPGDYVEAGTPLMEIDPARQQAAVNSSAAAIESARADVENARATLLSYEAERLERQADVEFFQRQFERYTALEQEGATSREERDDYANQLAVAAASLKATEAQMKAQQAEIARAERVLQQQQSNTQQAQVELDYYSITAPFAGVVGDIPPRVGDFVDTDSNLITVTQNNPLEVNLAVPSEQAARLRTGMPIELLSADGQAVGTASVSFISPNTSNTTQSVLVKALYDNSGQALRADQQVRARVIWSRKPGVTIPTTSVSRIAGETFVYVADRARQGEGMVVRQQPVQLGRIEGNHYQVMDGVKPGEQIAVTGLLQLSDGATIVPES